MWQLIFLTLIQAEQPNDLWVVIVNASKFYFNYRHTVNALMIYRQVKRLGVPDDHIILMLPENIACHPRNPYPDTVINGFDNENLFGPEIEVDYRGPDITPETIIQVLTGRHPEGTPLNKQMRSNAKSNILVYMSGHGGDSYFKIQDTLVIRNIEIQQALQDMHANKRFNEIMILIDTCQAESLFRYVDVPNVHFITSSLTHQMALSFGMNVEIGLSTTDTFTFFFVERLKKLNMLNIQNTSLHHILAHFNEKTVKSDPGFLSEKTMQEIMLKDFFSMPRGRPLPKVGKREEGVYNYKKPRRLEQSKYARPKADIKEGKLGGGILSAILVLCIFVIGTGYKQNLRYLCAFNRFL